ncbi:MAG TPA: long-chain fatty acid--CoA ligase [Acidobacteriaceae bacterium]|nr:long-chain fatty acid--CoA ligase [Acidobacteriaceae bacterium]
MLSTMMRCPLLVSSILERAGKLFGDAAIVSANADGSYARSTMLNLHQRSRRLSAALQGSGISRGDRVATLMWNQLEHLEAYFAVPSVGAVLHTLNFRLHPDDVAYIVRHAEDRFLIVDSRLLDVLERIRSKVQLQRVFVVGDVQNGLPEGTESYEAFLNGTDGMPVYPDLDEEAAAAMCYTSGTTGTPKGVLYSHRSISLHALAISLPDQLSLSRFDTVLPIASMFHVNAWGLPYAAAMNGSRVVLPGQNLRAEALLDMMEREQVTVAASVPAVLQTILQATDEHPGRWKLADGLRILVAGSAAPDSMFRRFDKLGVRLIHAWGMTETSPIAAVSRVNPGMAEWSPDAVYEKRGRQGAPLPFIDVRVVNDSGEAAWDGAADGELQVRGPWIAGAYHGGQQPEKWTADGWLKTGDVATIDSDGYLKLTDRLKDLIKSGGEWISSVDLESALMDHDSVRAAAVIAVPHPKWQERPLALVILKDGWVIEDRELRSFLEQRFARWQVPDAFVRVKELPYTPTGKLMKSKLRQEFSTWEWDRL